MHDPMVVAHKIRRPWPSKSSGGMNRDKRWAWQRHGPWWKPGSWSPFVRAFGRSWYFPALVTVWHVEPGGRDSGEVCKHSHRWQDEDGKWHAKVVRGWRWHVWHWHLQIGPLQELRARLFDRCAECGRKGRPNASHQWDGPGIGWRKWRSRQGIYHMECSSLIHMRRTKDADEDMLRKLFAAYRLATDQTEVEALEALTGSRSHAMEFHQQRRLWMLLGYERGESYQLVRTAPPAPQFMEKPAP
jgi:hypothetical protein